MKKAELKNELIEFMGGCRFMNRTDLARFIGYKDPHNASEFLHGLKRIGNKYYVGDIAESLIDSGKY